MTKNSDGKRENTMKATTMHTWTMRSASKKSLNLHIGVWLTAVFLFQTSIAFAQPQLSIEMTAAVQITSTDNNGERIVSYELTESVQPGAIISYTINYQNIGDQDAVGTSLVGVIPVNATYLESLDVDNDFEIQFSSDGGENFASPPFTFVSTDDNGNTASIEAGPDNYTHIRFTATTPVAPGISGNVSYLVQIN